MTAGTFSHTRYRSGLFVSAPEQYPIQCPDGNCTGINATAGAVRQESGYAANAVADARFGLQSWPLFFVGAGNGDLNSPNPDEGRKNVRSDSLVRWMAFSAIAYGATGLNYYCWGGGIWYTDNSLVRPGRPTPSYATVREVNADASAWGDELLAAGESLATTLHSGGGPYPGTGGGPPSEASVVTSMDDLLLVGVFTAADAPGAAHLVVVSKQVSGQRAPLAARNVTLTLHPSVGSAEFAPPGVQVRRDRDLHSISARFTYDGGHSFQGAGASGFDELRARHGGAPPPRGRGVRRTQRARVGRAPGSRRAALSVTVELVGGGAALLRLNAASGAEAELVDACFASASWVYRPADASLNVRSPVMNVGIKAPSWAYDSWHTLYRPYEGLEVTAGRSFEDGEQTGFLIGASFAGASPPTDAAEAKAWAWAGYNLLSIEAPPAADLASYGAATAAIGQTLDHGYPFAYFVAVEPAPRAPTLSASQVAELNRAFRCHGRWAGLLLARDASNDGARADGAALRVASRGASLDQVAAPLGAMRRSGNWLLPLATARTAEVALALGAAGLYLAMPQAPPFPGGATAARAANWAQQVALGWEPMRAMLARSYVPQGSTWRSEAPMPFVAAVDACGSGSDSALRWAAFSALAYGARGVYWAGAAACAAVGTPKFGLLASINKRLTGWGNTFVPSVGPGDFPGGGYNVTRLWATGALPLPHAVAPGAGGPTDLVQAADDDLLVAELGSLGRPETPLIYVVDRRVSATPGAAAARTLRVSLRADVTATQPIEGDCAASRCQCGLSNLGNEVVIRLPGGAGQLVGLGIATPVAA